jgi:hypothetical protein
MFSSESPRPISEMLFLKFSSPLFELKSFGKQGFGSDSRSRSALDPHFDLESLDLDLDPHFDKSPDPEPYFDVLFYFFSCNKKLVFGKN